MKNFMNKDKSKTIEIEKQKKDKLAKKLKENIVKRKKLKKI
jgi:hypothetical protein